MSSPLFQLFAFSWLVVLAWRLHRYAGNKIMWTVISAFLAWMTYASLLAWKGQLSVLTPPPRLLLLLVPVAGFTFWLTWSSSASALAERIPLRELVGLQAFRFGVELFLDRLYRQNQVPVGMTFHGHNFDILIAVSALGLYIFWNQLPRPEAYMKVWNILGLLFLANVVITGILSAPGPTHFINLDHPNLAIETFPYVLIPALFVVSALSLHILALKRLRKA